MVQVRKLVLAIAAASALSSGMAHALGLGEVTLKSTPNQPLLAEIELQDVSGLSASDIVPSLASPQAFADAGVSRQDFLNDLTFTPVINPNGRSVVRVTSNKPLSEAYVRFLVQVQWPNGRLMRDYSVLLDPSKYTQAPDAAKPAAAAPANAAAAPVAPVTAPTKAKQYTTGPRDTLWEIAAKESNGGSVQQTMLAIQALNPGAFLDGNINRLKTGQVLRLPDHAQSTALPQSKAIAEVAAQNAAWRSGRRLVHGGKQQIDATRHKGSEGAPAKAAGKDNLSLVSATSGRKHGKGAAGDSKALNNKLAVTQESLDTTRRDNAELKSRMEDLQSQLDKLQRLIQLKNDQLAKLQAEGSGAAPATGQPANAMSAQLAAKPEAAPAPVAPAPVAPAPVVPAAEVAKPTPVEAPIQPDAAVPQERKLDDLLSSPILMGLLAGSAVLVFLLLLLFLVRRRKAKQEAEKHQRMARALSEESGFSEELDLPESSFEGLEVPPPSVKLAPAPAPVPAAERPVDALDQANLHIQRGHLNQAAGVLEEAVKFEPQRTDLRLKLMEVYGQQGDRDAFIAQEKQLPAGRHQAEVEQLKSRFPSMIVVAAGLGAAAVAAELSEDFVKELLSDEPPAPAPVPAPAPAAPEVPVVAAADDVFDNDFDLSLDDLEAASPTLVAPSTMDLDDLQLDDDLSFESVLAQQAEAKPSLDDDLSFESVLEQQPQAKPALDDLADFDLDLGGDAPLSTSADEDFLLSLTEDLKDSDAEVPTLGAGGLDDLGLPADFDLSLADELEAHSGPNAFTDELDDVNAELDRLSQSLEQPPLATPSLVADELPEDESFDFLSGTDEAATKLDLAQAYMDMDDRDGARDILAEVMNEGSEAQKNEAREMLKRLA
ncbi:FimV/HubP family polar landmark protein [Pseudomonas batumici]|uniref:Putative type IV pilus assembly FimV-related transmembrane protein n=1 Tax=Pseudomonas batumici TaxID=226910 RepID=A0A0C2I9M4_9PSED|nr:FimV/HubP family polar landmark protein [Pseudomonas batumici]KIH85976.1 putative type IV pilus assembly FimV-related transmembrane protein [Pseudomonas batumici]